MRFGSCAWAAPPGAFLQLRTLSGARRGVGSRLPADLETLERISGECGVFHTSTEAAAQQLSGLQRLLPLTVRMVPGYRRAHVCNKNLLSPSFLAALPASLRSASFQDCNVWAADGGRASLRSLSQAEAQPHLELADWRVYEGGGMCGDKVAMVSFQVWSRTA